MPLAHFRSVIEKHGYPRGSGSMPLRKKFAKLHLNVRNFIVLSKTTFKVFFV